MNSFCIYEEQHGMNNSIYLLGLLLFPNYSLAHEGRTNSDGCHTSIVDGGHHCHGVTLPPTPCPPYDRSNYPHWKDEDGDCQKTRDEVLISESLISPKLKNNGCKVESGLWYDHFTGAYFESIGDIQIDHIVPLKEAHISGACLWSRSKKQRYANSLKEHAVLLGVKGSVNQSKGAKDPARWMPPNRNFHCAYIKMWKRVKEKWNLSFDKRESQKISEVLEDCD